MRSRLSPLPIIIMVAISGWVEISTRSTDVPKQRSRALNIEFIEDLVIKSAGPNNEYSFSAAGVETDSQGNIYILNLNDLNVLKFNARGEFLGACPRPAARVFLQHLRSGGKQPVEALAQVGGRRARLPRRPGVLHLRRDRGQ